MSTYAFVAPIRPGKLEDWKAFTKQLAGEKKAEYVASRKRAGLTRETAYHQKSPMGDLVVVVMDSPGDTAAAIGRLFQSKDPFDLWFAKRVEEIHGITGADMAKMPVNSVHLDWHA
jgi:hypothetical protein